MPKTRRCGTEFGLNLIERRLQARTAGVLEIAEDLGLVRRQGGLRPSLRPLQLRLCPDRELQEARVMLVQIFDRVRCSGRLAVCGEHSCVDVIGLNDREQNRPRPFVGAKPIEGSRDHA
jgi:hypothetical protein